MRRVQRELVLEPTRPRGPLLRGRLRRQGGEPIAPERVLLGGVSGRLRVKVEEEGRVVGVVAQVQRRAVPPDDTKSNQ